MVFNVKPDQIKYLSVRVFDALCPPACAACGQVGADICRICRCTIVEELRSNRASSSIATQTVVSGFEGRIRDVISGMKFKHHRGAARYLGGLIARQLINDGVIPGRDVEAVTWVPTTKQRLRERGFDPSEVMARVVGVQLGLPVIRTLDRVDSGEQKTRTRIERWNGPGFLGRQTRCDRVVLVDDIITTGATIAAASGALRTSGISHIHIAAVAATPCRRAEALSFTDERYSTAA